MGATTLGSAVNKVKDELETEEKKIVKDMPKVQPESGLSLSLDETKFILAKLAQMQYSGVEIEFIYHLLQKLQNHLQYLITKESK